MFSQEKQRDIRQANKRSTEAVVDIHNSDLEDTYLFESTSKASNPYVNNDKIDRSAEKRAIAINNIIDKHGGDRESILKTKLRLDWLGSISYKLVVGITGVGLTGLLTESLVSGVDPATEIPPYYWVRMLCVGICAFGISMVAFVTHFADRSDLHEEALKSIDQNHPE